MVKISHDHFPEETQKVLNGLSASGEAVDAVVDFADRTTGRVVRKKWNSLDQATRDKLAGYGKILSVVVPATKVRASASVAGVVTKGSMLGANGTKTASKTLWKGKGKEGIDVENHNPGQRPGQVHYQDNKNNKYLYDPETQPFPDAPKSVNKLLNDKNFRLKQIKP